MRDFSEVAFAIAGHTCIEEEINKKLLQIFKTFPRSYRISKIKLAILGKLYWETGHYALIYQSVYSPHWAVILGFADKVTWLTVGRLTDQYTLLLQSRFSHSFASQLCSMPWHSVVIKNKREENTRPHTSNEMSYQKQSVHLLEMFVNS